MTESHSRTEIKCTKKDILKTETKWLVETSRKWELLMLTAMYTLHQLATSNHLLVNKKNHNCVKTNKYIHIQSKNQLYIITFYKIYSIQPFVEESLTYPNTALYIYITSIYDRLQMVNLQNTLWRLKL